MRIIAQNSTDNILQHSYIYHNICDMHQKLLHQ